MHFGVHIIGAGAMANGDKLVEVAQKTVRRPAAKMAGPVEGVRLDGTHERRRDRRRRDCRL